MLLIIYLPAAGVFDVGIFVVDRFVLSAKIGKIDVVFNLPSALGPGVGRVFVILRLPPQFIKPLLEIVHRPLFMFDKVTVRGLKLNWPWQAGFLS